MSDPRRLLVAFSDIHAGGSTAAFRKPLMMDDGAEVHPGPLNKAMASMMEQAADWAMARSLHYGSAGADRQGSIANVLLHNGDATEGKHHHTHQVLIPEQTSYQVTIGLDLFGIFINRLDPVAVLMTRGTEAHVGKGGELEEAIAKTLLANGVPVMRAPDTKQLVPQYWEIELAGFSVWAAHHGKIGRLPHTKGSQAALFAAHTFLQEALDNFKRTQDGEEAHPIPRILIGSHHHQKADSGPHFPTRALQLGCWTFRNSFAHKVAAFSREDIGLAAIFFDPDNDEPEVKWWSWSPRRTTRIVI